MDTVQTALGQTGHGAALLVATLFGVLNTQYWPWFIGFALPWLIAAFQNPKWNSGAKTAVVIVVSFGVALGQVVRLTGGITLENLGLATLETFALTTLFYAFVWKKLHGQDRNGVPTAAGIETFEQATTDLMASAWGMTTAAAQAVAAFSSRWFVATAPVQDAPAVPEAPAAAPVAQPATALLSPEQIAQIKAEIIAEMFPATGEHFGLPSPIDNAAGVPLPFVTPLPAPSAPYPAAADAAAEGQTS